MDLPLESLSREELIALFYKEKEDKKAALEASLNSQNKIRNLEGSLEEYGLKIQQNRLEMEQKDRTLEDLNKALLRKDWDIAYYKDRIALLQRLLYGQKRERFEGTPDGIQGVLPFEPSAEELEVKQEQVKQKIEYERSKRPNHKGRAKLPENLPVEVEHIYPENYQAEKDLLVEIGQEITEELEVVPTRFYIKRYIRHKFAYRKKAHSKDKQSEPKEGEANGETETKEGVVIGELPSRVIDKGIPGASVLSMVLCDKYLDHLPLYRQRQRFARDGIEIPSSTLEGWVRQAAERLEPLYELLKFRTQSKGYLQVDETPIKVQDRDKKKACHQGYYWVYYSPIDGSVLFDYHPTRSKEAPRPMLESFKGYLQTDGYGVYRDYGKQKDVVHLACWAHARREFERALDNDEVQAKHALELIQKLYAVERKAKEAGLSPEDIKALRLNDSLPVINELGKWIAGEIKHTLPKSRIGKAMAYSLDRWDQLSAYLYDGILEIDNNPVENAIRPVALGRKNYLFAGSHEAAQRAAMVYSLLATCKKQGINPFEWLQYVLTHIMDINHKQLSTLLPQQYKNLPQSQKM